MKKSRLLALGLLIAVILFGLSIAAANWLTASRNIKTDVTVAIDDPDLIATGKYINYAADCAACHTVPGGQPFAGGLAMETPIGAIYSTNITPDIETGIGSYSYADFKNAVQHGVRKDGQPLYPAMPYPSYVIMPDEEIQALYAYFMSAVEPVVKPNAESTIPWPLDMRWPLAGWQLLFAQPREFTTDFTDDQLIRGAYLVEGPGHCGACHTPRGMAYQEMAMFDNAANVYLSGEIIDGWRAKSLRGEAQGLQSWTAEDVQLFLKTGRTDKSMAFGAMADAVEHGTKYLSDYDTGAIAAYLKQLKPAPNKILEFSEKSDITTQALLDGDLTTKGASLYMENCVVCHQADGRGIPRIFPALDGNSAVFSKYPQSVIQVTLEGGTAPTNDYDVMTFAMPGFAHLSDAEIVEVVNFIRTSWTNQAGEIKSSDVAHIRSFLNSKSPNIQ